MTVPALAELPLGEQTEDAFLCQRPACGHPPSWHRLDDATNVSPVDPKAKFRCIGYDCEAAGPPQPPCGCPDYLEHPQYAAWIQVRVTRQSEHRCHAV